MIRRPPRSALVPNATRFRSVSDANALTVGDVATVSGTLSGVTGSTVSLTASNGALTINDSGASSDINATAAVRSEAHTSELKSRPDLVCRLMTDTQKYIPTP